MSAGAGALRVAELTARAPGGVAVLEVSGSGAVAAVERLCGRPLPPPGAVRLVRLVEGTELLDEALVAPLDAERVELWLHGSPAVTARVRRALGAGRDGGASPLEPGASSDAAPVAWAEVAARRLVRASSEAGARVLLDQSEGALDRALTGLAHAADPVAAARALVDAARDARPFLDPPLVVLTGPVNAGKSTLFNLAVGHERALATEQPGTTRDAVRERGRDGDLVVEFVDTAGERELPADGDGRAAVERAGQVLARRYAERADLELACAPLHASSPARGPRRLVVRTFSGASSATASSATASTADASALDALAIDAVEAPAAARAALWAALRRALAVAPRPWVPGRAVPFEPALVAALEEALAAGAGAVRAAAADGRFAPRRFSI